MAQTANFQLSKPNQGASDWHIDLNENFDVIDSQIKVAQTLTSSKINSALGFTPLNPANKGAADGYASLNAAGKVPLTQLAINSSLITNALGFTPESTSNKGAANGYASLDSNGKVPLSELNITSGIVTAALGYTPENVANKGVANGYAELDSNAKIPTSQLNITSGQINSAIGFTPTNSTTKGEANGYASLDSNGKIPDAQLSITSTHVTDALGYTPEDSNNKGAPSGYASLDSNGQIPVAELPEVSFSSLSDIELSSLSSNQILQYDGTKWINADASASGVTVLSGMSDVQISSPSSGQILQYNGTNWVNAAAPSSAVPIPVRQTVLTGSVDATTGTANFLSVGSGLSVNLAATTVPVNIAFANGFGSGGAVDYVSITSSDVTSAFSSLPASSTSYLYVDRNSSTGALTYGSVTSAPVYSSVEPLVEVTSGAATSSVTATSGNEASKLFDKNPATGFVASASTTGIITFVPTAAFCLVRYNLTAWDTTSPGRMPRDWTVQGSNDGNTWTTIDTRSNQTSWVSGETRRFTVSNSTTYAQYRINVSANNGTNFLEIRGLSLWGTPLVNQHWFDLNAMQMKVWNGSSWETKQRVFLGEAVTGASSVTSAITYALQGRYESEVFAVTKNTNYTKSHNIGTDQLVAKGYYRYDQNYVWTDIMPFKAQSFYGARIFPDRNTVKLGTSADYFTWGSSAWPIFGIENSPAGNQVSGEAKLIVRRSW